MERSLWLARYENKIHPPWRIAWNLKERSQRRELERIFVSRYKIRLTFDRFDELSRLLRGNCNSRKTNKTFQTIIQRAFHLQERE